MVDRDEQRRIAEELGIDVGDLNLSPTAKDQQKPISASQSSMDFGRGSHKNSNYKSSDEATFGSKASTKVKKTPTVTV